MQTNSLAFRPTVMLPKIRTATPDDAIAIAEIGKAAFTDAFGSLFRDSQQLQKYLDHTYDPGKLKGSLAKENNIYEIAMLGDVPVAFTKMKKNSLNENIESIGQAELQKIYVLPGHQGSGIGKLLMDSVIQHGRSLQQDYIWLDVHISNNRAIAFYEIYGFAKHAKKYFTIGDQVFQYHVMVCSLK